MPPPRRHPSLPRRAFLQRASAASLLALAAPSPFAASITPAKPLRLGVVGCGRRGLDLARKAAATRRFTVTALADFAPAGVAAARRQLAADGIPVPEAACFSGADACERLANGPVDAVLDATPPAFRPSHFRLLARAGRHVLLELPLAVDAPGLRSLLAHAADAQRAGLSVALAAPFRHDPRRAWTVKQLRDGAIGALVEARLYSLGPEPPVREPMDATTLAGQVRNWRHYLWLSGDLLLTTHLGSLDLLHAVRGDLPQRATALGGRQTRLVGDVYDHFAVELEYEGGFRSFSQCRESNGCEQVTTPAFRGREGVSDGLTYVETRAGRREAPAATADPDTLLLEAFAASIEQGAPLAEVPLGVQVTGMGLLGRTSAYTGKTLEWDQVFQSQQSLVPDPLTAPPVIGPAPVPGKYAFS